MDSATNALVPDAHAPRAGHDLDVGLARDTVARKPPAIEQFIHRMQCVPRFLSVLNLRMGGRLSPHDLSDLAQDVFVIVWRKLPDYAGEGSLESWVFRICLFEARNYLRRRSRQRGLNLEEIGEPATEAAAIDELSGVLARLERLKPEERQVVHAKHVDDLTFEQIAHQLGISINTAKSRYYRGLARLRPARGAAEERSE